MKQIIKDYSIIILGSIILSFSISAFLIPSQIGIGGVTGIAMVINKILGYKIGLLTIIINIPLFISGFKLLGKKFAFRSAFVVFLSSIMMDYFNSAFKFKAIDDMLLSSIFFGFLFGISVYLLLISSSSTGGLDILAKIIHNKYKNIPLSSIMMIQDVVVYSLIAYVFGVRSVMYALIASFIRTKTIDAIQEGIASSRQCIIICENAPAIINEISTKLVRGVTVLDAVGGYSNDKKKFIYVVIQRSQLNYLKNIVKDLEPNAFISVSPVNDILGNYRQSLTIE